MNNNKLTELEQRMVNAIRPHGLDGLMFAMETIAVVVAFPEAVDVLRELEERGDYEAVRAAVAEYMQKLNGAR